MKFDIARAIAIENHLSKRMKRVCEIKDAKCEFHLFCEINLIPFPFFAVALSKMLKIDRERWMWYGGLTTVEYLQNLWDFFEDEEKYRDIIYYNFCWMGLDRPSFFSRYFENLHKN